MGQAAADEPADSTMLRLSRAVDDLMAPAPASSDPPDPARARRFERAVNRPESATVLDLRDDCTPQRVNGDLTKGSAADSDVLTPSDLAKLAELLKESLAAGDEAAAARVDDLAASLNLFAHEGIVAGGALDVLTTSVEHHLARLSQTRASLDGLAGLVERQRADGQAMAAQLDVVDAAQRAARDTTAAALDRVTGAVAASRARLTTVEQAVSRLQAWARDAQADVEPLDQRLAALDSLVAELQSDDRLAAVEAKLAELAADREDTVATLRAELDGTAARAEELAVVVQRQASALTRLRAQVKALTPPSKAVKAVESPAARKRSAR